MKFFHAMKKSYIIKKSCLLKKSHNKKKSYSKKKHTLLKKSQSLIYMFLAKYRRIYETFSQYREIHTNEKIAVARSHQKHRFLERFW